MNKNIFKQVAAILVITFSMLGCASVGEPPNQLLTQAESSVKSANELGAKEHAPLVIRSAEMHLAAAKKAMKEEEYKKATQLLEKTLADTELATATTQAEKSEEAEKQVKENLNALKQALQE